jgi:hypothetical protein
MKLFDTNYLLASLLWGSIGVGYFIYGKRQRAVVPLVGGVLMIAASYFAPDVLLMSLLCVGLMAAVFVLVKRDY